MVLEVPWGAEGAEPWERRRLGRLSAAEPKAPSHPPFLQALPRWRARHAPDPWALEHSEVNRSSIILERNLATGLSGNEPPETAALPGLQALRAAPEPPQP